MFDFGTWLLVNLFTALFPPVDEEERDFYEALGVSRDATSEQIRQAYRKKSLQLHPDKIAQRRQTVDIEEAKKEYEQVQEAYNVLMNDKKRARYHAVGCSGARYRFLSQGFANPGALYENLTHASTVDKTRLVLLCSVLVMLILLQPILIAAKVNQITDGSGGSLESTKWVVLLIPTWMMMGKETGKMRRSFSLLDASVRTQP